MRRRYLIKNETTYRTADIRAFVRKAAAVVFDPGTKPVLHIRVTSARRGVVRGRAAIGGTSMTIRLGPEIADKRSVAALIVHEMGHLRGIEHREMRGAARWTWKGTTWDRWMAAHEWGRDMPLREEEHRPRLTGAERSDVRRERAMQALERWTKKAKRAATAIKKLRARVKYYDRRAAAMGGET